ncbi:hypothetical protein IFM12276_03420 [Nocardia sputorum]|uniref:Uncharacterized protein n=1 Tax=Nocardia sputorum TaxID=2984338 RepID=A0ABM8CQR9_9NOCA|nr:hypothetical protein IFM12276_03420 [Nocardia sputorum]
MPDAGLLLGRGGVPALPGVTGGPQNATERALATLSNRKSAEAGSQAVSITCPASRGHLGHRAWIDDARAVLRAVAAGRSTPEERQRYATRRNTTGTAAPDTGIPTPPKPPQKRDRGISR